MLYSPMSWMLRKKKYLVSGRLLKLLKLPSNIFLMTTTKEATDEPKKKRATRAKKTITTDKSDTKLPDEKKKRGRKPKGGKIIASVVQEENIIVSEPNIILHLKCGVNDLNNNITLHSPITNESTNDSIQKNPTSFQFDNKNESLPFELLNSTNTQNSVKASRDKTNDDASKDNLSCKLKDLAMNLHTNNISDKKSACFYCTCDFDNPPIYIPKYELDGCYHVYGCFCSPECACGHLFGQSDLKASTRFERYHLLNNIYCKIFDYKKNIKPAPDPYYTLDKFYGNLDIREYRQLLDTERILHVIDKPLVRSLPELHEDNSDFMISSGTMSTNSKFKLRRSNKKQSKSEILSSAFNLS